MSGPRTILIVNPYIHDFAAYNLWMRPYGLIQIYEKLTESGCCVHFLDALFPSETEADEHGLKWPEMKRYHTGKFPEQKISRPLPYKNIPGCYRRFGVPEAVFAERLKAVPEPDCVIMTSGMTYWYPGVQETVNLLRKSFPRCYIILGGVYATLCTAHARRYAGADMVLPGRWQKALLPALRNLFGIELAKKERPWPSRILSLQKKLYPDTGFGVVRLTSGCPFNCSYCASGSLSGPFSAFSVAEIYNQIEDAESAGIADIAFYDDALLYDSGRLFLPLLKMLAAGIASCRFHTPNGLHARYMTEEIAELMYACNFKTVRLSFDRLKNSDWGDRKAGAKELIQAVTALSKAGYRPDEIVIYNLTGTRRQNESGILDTARFVRDIGASVKFARYSPTPGTVMYAEDCSKLPALEDEPLLHNSSIAPLWGFNPERYDRLKTLAGKKI